MESQAIHFPSIRGVVSLSVTSYWLGYKPSV